MVRWSQGLGMLKTIGYRWKTKISVSSISIKALPHLRDTFIFIGRRCSQEPHAKFCQSKRLHLSEGRMPQP